MNKLLYDINWSDGSLRTVRLIETSIVEGASVPTRLCRDETGRKFRCSTSMYHDTPKQAYEKYIKGLESGIVTQADEIVRMKEHLVAIKTELARAKRKLKTLRVS